MNSDKRLEIQNKRLLERIQILQTVLKQKSRRELEARSNLENLLQVNLDLHTSVEPVLFKGLSIIICAYNIPKQIKRTLASCIPQYQKAVPGSIEVIIVDNGSSIPIDIKSIQHRYPLVRKVIRVDGQPSPVFGLNQGIKQAKYDHIAVMIDGAHIPVSYTHLTLPTKA